MMTILRARKGQFFNLANATDVRTILSEDKSALAQNLARDYNLPLILITFIDGRQEVLEDSFKSDEDAEETVHYIGLAASQNCYINSQNLVLKKEAEKRMAEGVAQNG
jgi:hypothetical protein